MTRPRLLDLFCGAGGCSVGYHRAGFDVVGVDIRPQPRYPFEFVQHDAMELLTDIADYGIQHVLEDACGPIAAIHASPPCQHYSEATLIKNRANHPDLLGPVRDLLTEIGLPWVIENVPGAPMRADFRLCGCMFGLGVARDRWFETSWHAFEMRPPCHHPEPVVNTLRSAHGPWYREHGRVPTRPEVAAAMGIDWMHGEEIKQAIPPAYTEHVGRQLLDHLATQTSGNPPGKEKQGES